MCAGGAVYLWMLSKELALTCCSVTVLLWAVALRYGGFTRKAQRAYQDGLAETNQVALSLGPHVATNVLVVYLLDMVKERVQLTRRLLSRWELGLACLF